MSQTAVQIIAHGSREIAEAAAAALDADPLLEGATYSILEEDEDKGVWRIDAFPTTDEEAAGVEASLRAHGGLTVVVEKLADADWLAMSLSGLPPVEAGRFFVYGAHDQGKVPADVVAIKIDAGAAFGTGHHGTTVGCLEALETVLTTSGAPKKVLDVGTGTGVLGIAANLTGTPIVVGTDIDSPSVRIANENAEINGAEAAFVEDGDLSHPAVTGPAPYDLVFANILARPLIELAPAITRLMTADGRAILSGLLRTQETEVLETYEALGFGVEQTIHHDAWSALLLRRKD
jgi:ribosomal protein L11 methyltransferase